MILIRICSGLKNLHEYKYHQKSVTLNRYSEYISTGNKEIMKDIDFDCLFELLEQQFKLYIKNIINAPINIEVEFWAKCINSPEHRIDVFSENAIRIKRVKRTDILADNHHNYVWNGFKLRSTSKEISLSLECSRCKSKQFKQLNLYKSDAFYLEKQVKNKIMFMVDSIFLINKNFFDQKYIKSCSSAYRYLEFNPNGINMIKKEEIAKFLDHLKIQAIKMEDAQKILLITYKYYDGLGLIDNFSKERHINVNKRYALGEYRNSFSVLHGKFIILNNGYAIDSLGLNILRPSDSLERQKLSGTYQWFTSCSKTLDGAYFEKHYPPQPEYQIERAFLGLGRNPSNFWHNTIEYMPKIWQFLSQSEPSQNVLIDHQQRETLQELIEAYRVEFKTKFHILSDSSVMVNKIDFGEWPVNSGECNLIPMKNRITFDKRLLQDYSDYVLEKAESSNIFEFDKVLILRKKNNRQLRRKKLLNYFCKVKGYKIIYPEDFSYFQQVNIFRNVKFLAVESGASLANIMFCRKLLMLYIIRPDNLQNDMTVHELLAEHLALNYKTLLVKPIRKRRPLESIENYSQTGGVVGIRELIMFHKYIK